MLHLKTMRRVITVILLLLLPLQITWATIIDYCEHERDPAAHHLGHHADEYAHADGAFHDDQPAEQSDYGHHHCHLSCYMGLTGHPALPELAPARPFHTRPQANYSSPPPERHQRPNWPRIA